jgi:hypothetical protein
LPRCAASKSVSHISCERHRDSTRLTLQPFSFASSNSAGIVSQAPAPVHFREVRALTRKHFLIGMTRVRNKALILGDALEFVGRHVDAIIAYDDASTDRTLEPPLHKCDKQSVSGD